jgi:predicted DNA-binding protein
MPLLYMAQRTQIHLSDGQRARVDELASRRRITMAEVVRRAIDAYVDQDDDLDATFGAAPGIGHAVQSRDEWTVADLLVDTDVCIDHLDGVKRLPDALIAGTGLVHQLTVLTRNAADSRKAPGPRVRAS